MDIKDFISMGGHTVIPVTVNDLERFGCFLIERAKQELVTEITNNTSEVYYSTDQVVAILNVSKMTLWRWAQPDKNYLIPIRIGSLTRYRKSDIDRMLDPGTK